MCHIKYTTAFYNLLFITNAQTKTKQSPVYSATEAIEDAVEAFSQSLSVFRLGFLLSIGKDSIDSTLLGEKKINKKTCRDLGFFPLQP